MKSLLLLIATVAGQVGVDPCLVESVVKVESNFRYNAVSHVGAKGLMQLMPIAVKDVYEQRESLAPICKSTAEKLDTDYFNSEWNLIIGSCFLQRLMLAYDGDKEKVLWAYNAGMGRVAKGFKPAETKQYIKKVREYVPQGSQCQAGASEKEEGRTENAVQFDERSRGLCNKQQLECSAKENAK